MGAATLKALLPKSPQASVEDTEQAQVRWFQDGARGGVMGDEKESEGNQGLNWYKVMKDEGGGRCSAMAWSRWGS